MSEQAPAPPRPGREDERDPSSAPHRSRPSDGAGGPTGPHRLRRPDGADGPTAPHRSRRYGDPGERPPAPAAEAGPRVTRRPDARLVAAVLAASGVLAQIVNPLLDGQALRAATVASVVLLAAAAVTHAAGALGARAAAALAITAGGLGLLAETLGVHTGLPFGDYAYTDGLGWQLFAVPVVVPLAWTMLAYPCLLLGRALGRTRPTTALAGGLTLAAWDLFLDPQMVAQGNWRWTTPHPALPGVPGIPLTNYAGWILVALVMVAVLDRALPAHRARGGEAVPAAVLAWTWLGSALGNLAFFDRPWVALYGGLAMGVFVLPYLLRLRKVSA